MFSFSQHYEIYEIVLASNTEGITSINFVLTHYGYYSRCQRSSCLKSYHLYGFCGSGAYKTVADTEFFFVFFKGLVLWSVMLSEGV